MHYGLYNPFGFWNFNSNLIYQESFCPESENVNKISFYQGFSASARINQTALFLSQYLANFARMRGNRILKKGS